MCIVQVTPLKADEFVATCMIINHNIHLEVQYFPAIFVHNFMLIFHDISCRYFMVFHDEISWWYFRMVRQPSTKQQVLAMERRSQLWYLEDVMSHSKILWVFHQNQLRVMIIKIIKVIIVVIIVIIIMIIIIIRRGTLHYNEQQLRVTLRLWSSLSSREPVLIIKMKWWEIWCW